MASGGAASGTPLIIARGAARARYVLCAAAVVLVAVSGHSGARMLLVIFGAGASYDSDPRYPPVPDTSRVESALYAAYIEAEAYRPPLTRDLFNDRNGPVLGRHGRLADLATRLRRSVADGAALESALEAVREEAEAEPRKAGQLVLLRFYLRDVLSALALPWTDFTHHATNYADLLGRIEGHRYRTGGRVALVTFNYDHLLVVACQDVLGSHRSPAWSDSYDLLHLHGFVGWAREVTFDAGSIGGLGPVADWADPKAWTEPAGAVRDYLLDIGSQLRPTDRVVAYSELPAVISLGTGYIPAISVPTVHKNNFECTPVQLSRMREVLPLATHVLVIGWRGMDSHFLRLWRDAMDTAPHSRGHNLKRIQIVDGDADNGRAVVERLGEVAGVTAPEVRISAAGFTDFLTGGDLEAFLGE